MNDQLPKVGERYRIEGLLASGGMGQVWKAIDESSGRRVALKRPRSTELAHSRLLFELEYHTLAQLEHPCIIEVYDYGIDEAGPYYTMELLDGSDLVELAPVAYRATCAHLHDVASSLALLHARRLLHCDLSPKNVRLTSQGTCKLFDFGTMAHFGLARQIAGTPPFIAPEALRNQPLENRCDLFALGGLAYWILTRRHAFPARHISELPELWRRPPAAPSSLVPDVPPELDDLVLSLLEIDPERRPRNAADVMSTLRAVGGLERREERVVARSFLARPRFVGRSTELERIQSGVRQAADGRGVAFMVSGHPGIGRSRLLHEAALAAQLTGAATLRVDSTRHSDNFALSGELVRRLLLSFPELAARCSPLLELLREPVGSQDAVPEDPIQRRSMLHVGLVDFFIGITRKVPLALFIDDVSQADDASIAVLATLARAAPEHRLTICACELSPTDEGSIPLATLRHAALPVRLHPLGPATITELVQGLFGDVPRVDRLAGWLYARTHGYPSECVELCQSFVERGVVCYGDGTWVLPSDVAALDVSGSSSQCAEMRTSTLRAGALRILEIASVARSALPLEVYRSSAEEADDFFDGLDELLVQGLLLPSDDRYGLAQASVRDRISSGMTAARRRELHARLGAALLRERAGSLDLGIEAGWHLLHGGRESLGADTLVQCGRELILRGDVSPRAFSALEAGIEVYEQEQRPLRELLRLKTLLIMRSFQYDYTLTARHGGSALEALFRVSGLALGERLGKYCGKRMGLVTALLATEVRRRLRSRGELPIVEAIGCYVTCVIAAFGAHAFCMDAAKLEELYAYARPLARFPRRSAAHVAFLACRALKLGIQGRESEHRRAWQEALELLSDSNACVELSPNDRQTLLIGSHLGLGLNEAARSGSRALDHADELERVGTVFARLAAHQIRYTHHLLRAEVRLAETHRNRVEGQVLEAGITPQVELLGAAIEGLVSILTQDIVGQRRSVETLRLLARKSPSLEPFVDAVEAAYRLSLGELDRARTLAESVVRRCPPRKLLGWPVFQAVLGAVYTAGGEPARARSVCRAALLRFTEEDKEYVCFHSLLEFELGVAEIACENPTSALRIAEAAVERRAVRAHPLMCGIMHSLGARAAAVLEQTDAQNRHLREMTRAFRATQNPALLRRAFRVLCAPTAPTGTGKGAFLRPSVAPELAQAALDRDWSLTTNATRGVTKITTPE